MYSVPWKISNMDCFAKMVRYWKGFWTHHSSYFSYTMLPNAFLVALRKFQTMLCFASLVDHRCKKTNIKTNKKETENETNRNLRNKKTKRKLSVPFKYVYASNLGQLQWPKPIVGMRVSCNFIKKGFVNNISLRIFWNLTEELFFITTRPASSVQT